MTTDSFERFTPGTSDPAELADIAAACLERLPPGRQPLKLYTQLSRLMVMSTFELAPLRASSKRLEVVLLQRPDTDPWWPNQWHLPGKTLMPSGQNEVKVTPYEEIADQLLAVECNGLHRIGSTMVFDAQVRTGIRGTEQTVFGWSTVDGLLEDEGRSGFFDIEKVLTDPPSGGLVVGHDLTIQRAQADYFESLR